jgi:hypothetical protein
MADHVTFDLFEGLSRLGKRDLSWYDSLTPDGKKAASPLVIMRWMTGTSDQAQLVRLNTFVNPYIFALGAEKPLLFKLLAAAATGKSSRYYWLKGPSTRPAEKLSIEVIKQYYGVSGREAQGYKVNGESMLEMAQELGWDDEQLKKLKDEIKKHGS